MEKSRVRRDLGQHQEGRAGSPGSGLSWPGIEPPAPTLEDCGQTL